MQLKEAPTSRWQGGITRELYRDIEDFGIRVSCAEIDPGEASFSDFSGYERILRIIAGEVLLGRKSGTTRLTPEDELRFSGNEKIQSSNSVTVIDFNIIYRPELYHIDFAESKGKQKHVSEHALVFALEKTVVTLKTQWILNKYDYLHIDFSRFEVQGYCFVVKWQNIRKLETSC